MIHYKKNSLLTHTLPRRSVYDSNNCRCHHVTGFLMTKRERKYLQPSVTADIIYFEFPKPSCYGYQILIFHWAQIDGNNNTLTFKAFRTAMQPFLSFVLCGTKFRHFKVAHGALWTLWWQKFADSLNCLLIQMMLVDYSVDQIPQRGTYYPP